jgi:hypothetical protein
MKTSQAFTFIPLLMKWPFKCLMSLELRIGLKVTLEFP